MQLIFVVYLMFSLTLISSNNFVDFLRFKKFKLSARVSSIVLNNSNDEKHSCLVPNAFQGSPLDTVFTLAVL